MNIKTKFSIGEEVYCIRKTYILPYKVTNIEVQVSRNVPNIKEFYRLQPLLPSAEDSQIRDLVPPEYLFKSKAQAIKKLFYVLEHPGNREALRGTKFIKEEQS